MSGSSKDSETTRDLQIARLRSMVDPDGEWDDKGLGRLLDAVLDKDSVKIPPPTEADIQEITETILDHPNAGILDHMIEPEDSFQAALSAVAAVSAFTSCAPPIERPPTDEPNESRIDGFAQIVEEYPDAWKRILKDGNVMVAFAEATGRRRLAAQDKPNQENQGRTPCPIKHDM